MEAKNFDQALADFRSRRPFQAFYVELNTGRIIKVKHPEALANQAGQAAYIAEDGAPSLFDHESVTRLFYSKQEPVEVRT